MKPCPRLIFSCKQQATTTVASGKIVSAKTNWSMHATHQLFHPNFTHNLRFTCHETCPFTCHATCPLAQEYYSPRGGSVSASHIGKPVRGPALRKQNNFAFLEAPKGLEIALFMKFRYLTRPLVHSCETLPSLEKNPNPMD